MGERAGAGAPAAVGISHEAGHAAAGGGGISAMLHDPKRMAALAKGLGSLGQPTATPAPAGMAPMDMGSGAAAAAGDPSALAALAQQRPDIFARMSRFNRGGY